VASRDAIFAAAELAWVEDDLTVRGVARRCDGSVNLAQPFGGMEALIDAMFERLCEETANVVCAFTLGIHVGNIANYWQLCLARPALLKAMTLGHGPGDRRSEDLAIARGRLRELVGYEVVDTICAVEALHGMIAGELAGRLTLTDEERRAAIAGVLAIGEGR
jgi:AcrR family transcriptional regulator